MADLQNNIRVVQLTSGSPTAETWTRTINATSVTFTGSAGSSLVVPKEGIKAYATLASLPNPTGVLTGTVAAVINDGLNNGLYYVTGVVGSNGTSWLQV